jgi:hypothetical protein
MASGPLSGRRILTFNSVIRVNQIEVTRTRNEGFDEYDRHTPENNSRPGRLNNPITMHLI